MLLIYFYLCNFTKQVWLRHALHTRTQYFDIENWTHGSQLTNFEEKEAHVKALVMITCWQVWKARNKKVFTKATASPTQVTKEAILEYSHSHRETTTLGKKKNHELDT